MLLLLVSHNKSRPFHKLAGCGLYSQNPQVTIPTRKSLAGYIVFLLKGKQLRVGSFCCGLESHHPPPAPLKPPDTVRTLSGHCPDTVRTLSGHCPETVRTLSDTVGHCLDTVRTLSGHCPDTVRTLSDTVRTLSGHCPGTVRTLSGHCPGTVRTLSGHCPDTVRTLSCCQDSRTAGQQHSRINRAEEHGQLVLSPVRLPEQLRSSR